MLAYTLVVGAYSGWNAPTYFAEEKTDPARQVPRALFMGVGLAAALYVLFNLGLARILPLPELSATPLPAAVAMRAVLGALPSEQRRVVELAYFGGFTHEQIAEMLGAPLGTVKGRMRLALEKMRASIEPREAVL